MIIGAAHAVNTRVGDKPITEEDCYVSYLPAAHSFEQAVFGMSCISGMKSGFFAGNVLKLTEDIGILKPSLSHQCQDSGTEFTERSRTACLLPPELRDGSSTEL